MQNCNKAASVHFDRRKRKHSKGITSFLAAKHGRCISRVKFKFRKHTFCPPSPREPHMYKSQSRTISWRADCLWSMGDGGVGGESGGHGVSEKNAKANAANVAMQACP